MFVYSLGACLKVNKGSKFLRDKEKIESKLNEILKASERSQYRLSEL